MKHLFWPRTKNIRLCLVYFFSSLNFRHSSLITHHSKYPTRLAPSITCHHSIFFILFVGPIPVTLCRIFFFSFSITEPSEKKKKEPNQWKKKEEPNCQPGEEREKKRVKSGQKVGLVLFVSPLCVFNYNIAIELWVMETENI